MTIETGKHLYATLHPTREQRKEQQERQQDERPRGSLEAGRELFERGGRGGDR
ncbi:MAG: hypothetical protein ACTHMQ_04215 [Protaetiibacter sp.]